MDTKKLRQKILDLAIHGRLVPQDPNDEPASVLLERIRAEKERLIKEGKIKRPKKSASSDMSHYGNDVPFELPEGWVWCTVEDIALFILYGVSESAKSSGTYRLLRITDIQNNKVDWSSVPYTDFDQIAAQKYILYPGDILFARTGATVGKSYLVEHIDCQSIYASYLIKIRPSRLINPKYVKRFFESGYYWEQISESSVGVGQPNVNGTSLANLMIPIPPLGEQNRIVEASEKWIEIIDNLDDCLADISQSIVDTKSKILDLAISGKLVPQDPTDEPAIDLLRRITPAFKPCDNPHYENNLPKGWCSACLGDVAEYGDTSNVDVDSIASDDWVLELEDIEKETAAIIDKKSKAEREISGVRHSFKKGQILYSKLRTYLNKVLIAPEDGFCTTEIVPISAGKALLPEYLLIVLRSPYFLEYTASCGYGVKMPRLGTNDAKNAIIPVPPVAEQARISRKVIELMSVMSLL